MGEGKGVSRSDCSATRARAITQGYYVSEIARLSSDHQARRLFLSILEELSAETAYSTPKAGFDGCLSCNESN